jgi:glutathione S-transferase
VIALYDYILSAEAYKARLLLRMLGVPYQPVKVDIHPGRQTTSLAFLALNPLGTLPVLTDGDLVLRDAQAILLYLASAYDKTGTWLPGASISPMGSGRAEAAHAAATNTAVFAAPAAAKTLAQISMWLAFAGQELADLSTLRMQCVTGAEPDNARLLPRSLRALDILDDHLAAAELDGRSWLVGHGPTIADIAVFPSVALAPDAAVSLTPDPALSRWVHQVKRLPNFIVMPGIHPILPGEA